MFGIGILELLVIVVCALLFIGPQKLPEFAKQLSRFFVHMRRITTDVRSTVDDYVRKTEEEMIGEQREELKKLFATGLEKSKELAEMGAVSQEIQDVKHALDHDHSQNHSQLGDETTPATDDQATTSSSSNSD